MLENLKLMLGIAADDTTQDDLLNLLLDNAKLFIVEYCNIDRYMNKLDPIAVKCAIEDYNRMGAEGLSGKGFSGVSESYNQDYSDSIYNSLKKHRRIRMF